MKPAMKIASACAAAWAFYPAHAQPVTGRQFPPQAAYCKIAGHGLPAEAAASIGGAKVQLSAALVIRDQNNRIVVNSQLPQKFEGMCVVGGGGLEKVWILTSERAQAAPLAGRERGQEDRR